MTETTVGDLTAQLSPLPPDAPVRLALNPFFPMAHRIGALVASHDEHGRATVFIAQHPDDDSDTYLPPDVAIQLMWHPPTSAPPR
ncbi:hypothetical protein [Streptomyces sp. RFCAC02]|uniref:hypothetical protein n=1 Tax=Streptomyces sp. RFCAC02 TaxID=2499143 RepID=UPI00101FD0CD|nr:hypothetical protein [Streptomyces sp. RFCAC02]